MVKISIRAGILILFATFLIIVGAVTMFVSYVSSEAVLLRSAENLVVRVSYNNIAAQTTSFLQLVHDRLDLGSRAISHNLLTPVPGERFNRFLLQVLGDSDNFYGIHWSNPQGNFIYIKRNPDGKTFTNEVVDCRSADFASCTETTQQLDRSGHAISALVTIPAQFDPRVRPWYVRAVREKHYIFSDIYVFFHELIVGITAAYPIYNDAGKLRGILSIDETLDALSDFVAGLQITQNGSIFIFSGDGNLIASKELRNYIGSSIPKISTIKVPGVQESFAIYKSSRKPVFFYKYNGERYFAFYRSIQNLVNNPWYIAIVFPVKDVTKVLKENLTNSILIASAIFLFGLFLASVMSRAISRPIMGLTDEAIMIEQMNLAQVTPLPISRVREINFLQEAFNAMKQSLSSFIRYVPATLVKKLIVSGDVAHVGGESREVTFLFSDIKSFTSISENIEPKALMDYLSEYFQVMTKIILAHQGTVDKYIGDAIMAFWGAPLDDKKHVEHACQCALEMQKEVEKLNTKWCSEGKPTIAIKIGINTGVAVIGNVGSEDRLSYTALGDSVNLASRLEGLNKEYRTKILVGDNTYQIVKEHFAFRLLDQVVVRGKHKSVYIYELLTDGALVSDKNKAYHDLFLTAFTLYQKSDWDGAIDNFKKLNNLYPDDNLALLYLERCKNFKINPPAKWDGIWRIS